MFGVQGNPFPNSYIYISSQGPLPINPRDQKKVTRDLYGTKIGGDVNKLDNEEWRTEVCSFV